MEFWSKGLGKRTIEMGLSKGESLVSEDALCLKGVMEEPVSWEYVMLLDEADIDDFFAILQEPSLASYIHRSPNRWRIYAGLVKGGAQIVWSVFVTMWKRKLGNVVHQERVVIQLPPPSVIKKRAKKRVLYRRRLSTTNLQTPSMCPSSSKAATAGTFKAGQA